MSPERRQHCGTGAWAALAALVLAYDLFAPETLSSAFKRGMDNKLTRPLVLGGLAMTAAHLTSVLPERLDPFKLAYDRLKAYTLPSLSGR